MSRQVQIRCGGTTLDLDVAPYTILAGGWSSAGKALELSALVSATTLAELDRYLAALQRMGTLAQQYDLLGVGDPVEVWTKVCDAVSTTAELGATWLRKRLTGLSVMHADPSTLAAGQYKVQVQISGECAEETWRRAAVASLLTASLTPTVRSDGGLTMAATGTLTAQRINSFLSGFTVRVRWLYSDNDCTFLLFEAGANDLKAWYQASTNKVYMQDSSATQAVSTALASTAGDELDLVFRWYPSTGMTIWINGVANGSAASCTVPASNPDTYQVFAPSTVSQSLLSWQVWPAVLTDAECAGLYAYGRPEPELACVLAPANTQNTNCLYALYNVPGEAPAGLRVLAATGAAEDQVRLALRPLRIPSTTVMRECENGTLGTGTVKTSDSDASGNYMARYTPTATTLATRVTVILVQNPTDLASHLGEYRLWLACKDNAAVPGRNKISFRVNVGGVAGDWSDEVYCAAIATRSLLDLGTFSLPPGSWPEESQDAATTGYGAGSNYVTIEVRSYNTVGSGGGTFDFDALYAAPAEMEGVAACSAMVYSTQWAVLDFTGEQPAGVLVFDRRSLEFGGWADWVGHDLRLLPGADGGVLWGYVYNDTAEKVYPEHTVTLTLFYEPRWRR